jgi:hypothetical protein
VTFSRLDLAREVVDHIDDFRARHVGRLDVLGKDSCRSTEGNGESEPSALLFAHLLSEWFLFAIVLAGGVVPLLFSSFPKALRAPHFVFTFLICWTSVSISSEVSLPAYFGIRPLPFVMMLCRSSVEVAFSEISDGPPK